MNRTLHPIVLCLVLILARVYPSKAQCPASTPPVINSVTTTESRCQASGAATIAASGGSTPYTYSIIAGPVLASSQSSNIFNSLAPGTYTVQLTDNCNTSVTKTFTVTGTYTVPTLSVTGQAPGCPGSSDGSITMTAGSGRAPLTYALISPSPVTAGPQSGNVFSGLPVGTYTCQIKDSCGNIQTRTVNLTAAPSSVLFNNSGTSLQYVACDSFDVYLSVTISNYKPPYIITETLPNGSVLTQVLTSPTVNSGNFIDTVPIRYHHVTGATEIMSITITNQCGISVTDTYTLSQNMDMSVDSVLSPTCGTGYMYTFDNFPQFDCPTVSYTLISPSGTVLATQANNSTFAGYPAGSGYTVIRHNCCRTDTIQFDWSATPVFQINYSQNVPYGTCKEGTTSLYIQFNYEKPVDVVLVSGPPSITLGDGSVYTYTYPDTITNVWSGAILAYFGPGTYKLYAFDPDCVQKDSLTVTFGPGDVRQTLFGATLEKGCADANKILLNVTSNTWWEPGTITVNSTSSQVYNQYVEAAATTFSDSVQNLSAGTYYAAYQFSNIYGLSFFNGMDSWGCDIVNDTIVIPPYTNPSFNPAAAVAVCGSTRSVALIPDSTTGVYPYEYQITSGPATTSLQASPVFTGLGAGTYTFQMLDACDNSYSRNISIDTLAMPGVVTTGITCIGADATFTLPASPFYNYTWKLPDGSISTGNALTLDPVSSSDIGTYVVTLTSTIAGCTNTTSSAYQLNSCQVLGETLLHFSGQWENGNIQLSWQTANETNMSYYIIERSTDGSVFTPVQQVTATEGTRNMYTATDAHVPTGAVYYRLAAVEQSGAINYSNIISFNSSNVQPFYVYPSQIRGNTLLTAICPPTSHASSIRIISVDGKVCQTIAIATGVTQTRIDVTGLASGVYFVVFAGEGNVMTTQIWKN